MVNAACNGVLPRTGDSSVKNLIKKWVDWVMSEIKLYDDGTFAIPSDLEWSGQPDTWTGTYTGNPNLHVRVTSYGTDLGVAGSLANALATYAAATERWEGKLDTKQETWLLNWLTVHGTTSTALKEKVLLLRKHVLTTNVSLSRKYTFGRLERYYAER